MQQQTVFSAACFTSIGEMSGATEKVSPASSSEVEKAYPKSADDKLEVANDHLATATEETKKAKNAFMR